MCKQVIQRENISSSQIHTATIDQRDSQKRKKNFTIMFTTSSIRNQGAIVSRHLFWHLRKDVNGNGQGFETAEQEKRKQKRRLESKLLNSIVSLDLLDSWCKRHLFKHLRRDVDSDGQGFEAPEPEKRKHGEGNRATNYWLQSSPWIWFFSCTSGTRLRVEEISACRERCLPRPQRWRDGVDVPP